MTPFAWMATYVAALLGAPAAAQLPHPVIDGCPIAGTSQPAAQVPQCCEIARLLFPIQAPIAALECNPALWVELSNATNDRTSGASDAAAVNPREQARLDLLSRRTAEALIELARAFRCEGLYSAAQLVVEKLNSHFTNADMEALRASPVAGSVAQASQRGENPFSVSILRAGSLNSAPQSFNIQARIQTVGGVNQAACPTCPLCASCCQNPASQIVQPSEDCIRPMAVCQPVPSVFVTSTVGLPILHRAYANLSQAEQALQRAYEAWRISKSKYDTGLISIAQFAQTRGQYEQSRGDRLQAMGNVLEVERILSTQAPTSAMLGRLAPSLAVFTSQMPHPGSTAVMGACSTILPQSTIMQPEELCPTVRPQTVPVGVKVPASMPTSVRFDVSGNQIRVQNDRLIACGDSITSLGDGRVLCEGNVCVEFVANQMPARIHAERIVVNLNDGSYEVNPVSEPAQARQVGYFTIRQAGHADPAQPLFDRVIKEYRVISKPSLFIRPGSIRKEGMPRIPENNLPR